jgi:ATP-dependent Clp protease protease subunit
MRTPPPDLPSLLLKERIVYLGLPLFSDDDAKRQMGIDGTASAKLQPAVLKR